MPKKLPERGGHPMIQELEPYCSYSRPPRRGGGHRQIRRHTKRGGLFVSLVTLCRLFGAGLEDLFSFNF